MHLNESHGSDRNGQSFSNQPFIGDSTSTESSPVDSTVRLLRQGFELAKRKRVDYRQFAIAIEQLRKFGISSDQLRMLISSGTCEHLHETSRSDSFLRTFAPASHEFVEQSCFVLGQTGMHQVPPIGQKTCRMDDPVIIKPVWDPASNELRIAGQLVKRFKWHAPNQERLIMAFEERNWPDKIEDPFPSDDAVDAKRRLHDTIKCLNRRHVSNLMRFHGDGTGEGVLWKISVDRPAQIETQGLPNRGSEGISGTGSATHSM